MAGATLYRFRFKMSSMMLRFSVAGAKRTSRALAVFSSRTASSCVRTARTTTLSFRAGSRLLRLSSGGRRCRILRVIHHEYATKVRHELLGHLEPLGDELGAEV